MDCNFGIHFCVSIGAEPLHSDNGGRISVKRVRTGDQDVSKKKKLIHPALGNLCGQTKKSGDLLKLFRGASMCSGRSPVFLCDRLPGFAGFAAKSKWHSSRVNQSPRACTKTCKKKIF